MKAMRYVIVDWKTSEIFQGYGMAGGVMIPKWKACGESGVAVIYETGEEAREVCAEIKASRYPAPCFPVGVAL